MIAMKDPRNDDKNLWVGWDEYHRLIELLALQVHESSWKFDKILCLARGGLRVLDAISVEAGDRSQTLLFLGLVERYLGLIELRLVLVQLVARNGLVIEE